MDYLDIEVTNPMFFGYMDEQKRRMAFNEKLDSIVRKCGNVISAHELNEKMKQKGINPYDLCPVDYEDIEKLFMLY